MHPESDRIQTPLENDTNNRQVQPLHHSTNIPSKLSSTSTQPQPQPQPRSPSPANTTVSTNSSVANPPPPPPGPPPPHFRTRRTSISPRARRQTSSIFKTKDNPKSNYDYALEEFKQTIDPSLSNDDGYGPGPGSDVSEVLMDSSSRIPSSTLRNRHILTLTRGVPPSSSSSSNMAMKMVLPQRHGGREHSTVMRKQQGLKPTNTSQKTITPTILTTQLSPTRTTAHRPRHEFSTASGLVAPSTHTETSPETPSPLQAPPPTTLQSHVHKLEQVEERDQLTSPNIITNQTAVDPTKKASMNTNPTMDSVWSHYQEEELPSNPPLPEHYGIYDSIMPDATYEEKYGDAYVGKPIKYLYPSGYTTLRPRGGPWKLSLIIFVFFIWLCVFIVGHCSDQADMAAGDDAVANDQNDQNDVNDGQQANYDDEFIIATRWCGSRTLYSMWVVTVLITAMAASYCSIIGYIKMRDFSVANCRSQPPGMLGKSEYYVKINDATHAPPPSPEDPGNGTQSSHTSQKPPPNIYQSDGTPQFWGGHIYRPTQAAVAVTSR